MNIFQSLSTTVCAQIATEVTNPVSNIKTLQDLFNFSINLVLAIGLSLTVIFLAAGFIQFIMSQGDKARIDKAQQWVTYAAVGGVGLFLVFAARAVIQSVCGKSLSVGNNVTIGSGN